MENKKSLRHKIIVKRHFDAAHKLENYQGKCAGLHGHRWTAEFHILVDKLDNGIAYDFNDVKAELDKLLPDHQYLNDIIKQPTAENIAEYLFKLVEKLYPLEKIVVWETPECAAVYYR